MLIAHSFLLAPCYSEESLREWKREETHGSKATGVVVASRSSTELQYFFPLPHRKRPVKQKKKKALKGPIRKIKSKIAMSFACT